MLGSAQVMRADARSLPLADNSVDLVISSPPYWSLRSYQDNGSHYDGQIGAEGSADEFLDALLDVMRECVRVLKPAGSIFYNLGDKYGPNKSLALIPERFRIRCTDELGLIARAVIVWSKPNGLPESVTDRVRRSHEDWMHFTLEPRYFSAVDELREAHDERYAQRRFTPAPLKARGNDDRNDGWSGVMRSEKQVTGNPLGKLPGSVWTVPTEPLRVPDHLGIDHFAAFPTEWPRRIIQGWSPAGVCVECGEGRRPTTSAEYEHVNFTAHTKSRAGNQIDSAHRTQASTAVSRKSVTITGQECACGTFTNEEIECAPHGSTEPFTPVTTRATSTNSSPTASARSAPTTPLTSRTTPPPTRPAVVLDPFAGTGTVALVAKALGRHGIAVDMSADYCRLAEWRTNDPAQIARVLKLRKPDPVDEEQMQLWA